MATPIADLSYRNYDGPLEPPIHRWWAIALMSIRLSVKKKGFWIWAAFAASPYLFQMATFYVVDTLFSNLPAGQRNPFFLQIVWKDRFLDGFSISQLFLFILALLIGAGTIANDNRAKALLVYLSKPCTRLDYIIGKWFGIFIPLVLVTAVPTFLFYLYCLMSYQSYGFITEDPRLLFRLLGMVLIPGAVHASLSLGISSLFDQGRLAGATFAGVYFMTLFFTKAMQFVSISTQNSDRPVPEIVNRLFYLSVDGIQIGLAKWVLGTDGSSLFAAAGGPGRRGGGRVGSTISALPVPAPDASYILAVALGLCALGVFVAWTRVRAVEVVG